MIRKHIQSLFPTHCLLNKYNPQIVEPFTNNYLLAIFGMKALLPILAGAANTLDYVSY